jgi:hypothetical protein
MDDWKEIAKYGWSLLLPLLVWLWKKQDARIDKQDERMESLASQKSVDEMAESLHSLRNKVVSREDFRAHEDRDQRDREERRDTEVKLFDKIDQFKDDVNEKFDTLKDLLLGRKQ